MSRAACRTLLILAIAATTAAAEAGERIHIVLPGESASAIAMRYYGSFEYAELLLRCNGRESTVLDVGDRLRVPYAELHRVQAGDSWSALAARYLGRVSAYPALAALNGLAPERALRVGESVVIPAVIEKRLASGESLSILAERFLGDRRHAPTLQQWNGIEDPRHLAVGRIVSIPVVSLRLVDRPAEPADDPPAEPIAAEPIAAEPAPRFEQQLRTAAGAYRAGEYDRARELLEALREPVVADGRIDERRDLLRLLTFVYVAFDLDEQSCAAFRALVELAPEESTMDPDLVSPKIRERIGGC